MSIPKFLDYLRIEKKYSPRTIESYSNDLEDFQVYYTSETNSKDLAKAKKLIFRSYLMKLSESGLSERSINRKISSLRSYYKFLLKTTEISQSPLAGFHFLKHTNKVQVPFSEDEMTSLFETEGIFPDSFEGRRDRLVMELFYQTGIRRSELIHLKVSDIDFDQKTIKVIGKGSKMRLLPVGGFLLDAIDNYIVERLNEFPSAGFELFLTSKGKAFYDKFVYNLVNSYLSLISTKQKKSPHMLRHSFATHMLNRGANLNVIKELLGHSSLAATQVYTHSSVDQLKKVFNQAHPRSEKN